MSFYTLALPHLMLQKSCETGISQGRQVRFKRPAQGSTDRKQKQTFPKASVHSTTARLPLAEGVCI